MTSVDEFPYSDQSIFRMSDYQDFTNLNHSFGFPTNQEFLNFNAQYNQQDGLIQFPLIPEQQQQQIAHQNQQYQQQQQLAQQTVSDSSAAFSLNLVDTLVVNNTKNLQSLDSLELDPLTSRLSLNSLDTRDNFPPVNAFVPAPIHENDPNFNSSSNFGFPQNQLSNVPQQRSRNLSEPNLLNPGFVNPGSTGPESTFSLSPDTTSISNQTSLGLNMYTFKSVGKTEDVEQEEEEEQITYKRYKVIRGLSSGGSATKPPKLVTSINHHYVPVDLQLVEATLKDLCYPTWSDLEKEDKRRIIRIERYQVAATIIAKFSIVGSAQENPETRKARSGVDVVEVSCLDCLTKYGEDTDDEDNEYSTDNDFNDTKRSFYITSVEVVKIVELLIGTEFQEAAERRRERGRIRSNLVPFWSKKPISSRMSNSELRSSPLPNDSSDFRVELATRIMGYDVRKPRGFDKEVRILRWEKLMPALHRALQSYYVEIPDEDDE